MAYQDHKFSGIVKSDPKRAAEEIVALYERLGSQKRVADHFRVSEGTMLRWIKRLEAKGTGILVKLDRKRSRIGGRPPQGSNRKALRKQGRSLDRRGTAT
jgi:transposase